MLSSHFVQLLFKSVKLFAGHLVHCGKDILELVYHIYGNVFVDFLFGAALQFFVQDLSLPVLLTWGSKLFIML